MNATMRPGLLHSPLRLKLWTALAALALVVLIIGGTLTLRQARGGRLVIPDERAVAAALLAQKLSGPRYFQLTSPAAGTLTVRAPDFREGEPFISVADAQTQVDRIVAERRLDAARAAKIRQLIDLLAKPADSRMVGEASVNLLRLNLALDELR